MRKSAVLIYRITDPLGARTPSLVQQSEIGRDVIGELVEHVRIDRRDRLAVVYPVVMAGHRFFDLRERHARSRVARRANDRDLRGIRFVAHGSSLRPNQ